VSRGDMNAGVMAGADMLSYVPLHLSSLQRSPSLRGWLKEWIGDGGLFLEASDWPRKHLNHGTYVWSCVGMVGGIDTQASYVGARDRDPATTHRSLEKAVGEANRCDVDCTSGLSCLASGQP